MAIVQCILSDDALYLYQVLRKYLKGFQSNRLEQLQYSHREIPISPARLGDTFCCLSDFLSFH